MVTSPSPDPEISGRASQVDNLMRNCRNTLGDTTRLDFDQLHLVGYAEDTFRVDGDGHEMVGKSEEVAPGVFHGSKNVKVEENWPHTGISMVLVSHSCHFVYQPGIAEDDVLKTEMRQRYSDLVNV